jgi:Fe2+ transport system protein FeoA
MLLSNTPSNTLVIITEVSNNKNSHLLQHGITPGQNIRVISNYPSQPMLIEVRNTYLALDAFYTNHIKVEIKK